MLNTSDLWSGQIDIDLMNRVLSSFARDVYCRGPMSYSSCRTGVGARLDGLHSGEQQRHHPGAPPGGDDEDDKYRPRWRPQGDSSF